MKAANRPCIIGVGQLTRSASNDLAPHPASFAAEAVRLAARDCGNDNILSEIDEIDFVLPISWLYDDPAGALAGEMNIAPGRSKVSGLSGTSPQLFVNEAARAIAAGEANAVVVCGAEAFNTLKRARFEGSDLNWPPPSDKAALPFEQLPASERRHEASSAYGQFALLDSARRARLGVPPEIYRRQAAETMARLSQVAAQNPLAWFPEAQCADDLFQTGSGNRMVAYPYTKRMMAFMDVDMAAALIVASDECADRLGVPREKRVYIHGWGYAQDAASIATRADLSRSAAMQIAAQSALQMAGLEIGAVAHLDLYSCFASALHFARDALGICEDDPRALTVTGGLPYFGGPGSNYTTHSIATMAERLRANPGDFGMVSGVGMYMANHAFGIYSSQPPSRLPLAPDGPKLQAARALVDTLAGKVEIIACTVLHEKHRDRALMICENAGGERCYAVSYDPGMLLSMEREEWVGRAVTLLPDEHGVNRVSQVLPRQTSEQEATGS